MTAGAHGALLVVGDVVTDIVARHRGPLAAGTDTAASIRKLPGGAGANVACWAAHRGCGDVRLVGRVGRDAAAWHERELLAAGVRPRLVVDEETPTGTVICLVDSEAAAERTFLTDSGASLRLGPGDWSDALLDGVARLPSVGVPPVLRVRPGAGGGRPGGGTRTWGAGESGSGVGRVPDGAGRGPLPGARRGCRRPAAQPCRGMPAHRADRRGRRGGGTEPATAAGGRQAGSGRRAGGARRGARAPGCPHPAVARDTTGAGDAFTGAFLAALLAGAAPEEATAEGCRAGALVVGQRPGGRPPGAGVGPGRDKGDSVSRARGGP
ncbi:Ribokinase [Streptomyces fumanus]